MTSAGDREIVATRVVDAPRERVWGPKFHATATFDDESGKTKLTMRLLFDTAEERDRTVKVFGAIEGAKQTLERLNQHVTKMGGK